MRAGLSGDGPLVGLGGGGEVGEDERQPNEHRQVGVVLAEGAHDRVGVGRRVNLREGSVGERQLGEHARHVERELPVPRRRAEQLAEGADGAARHKLRHRAAHRHVAQRRRREDEELHRPRRQRRHAVVAVAVASTAAVGVGPARGAEERREGGDDALLGEGALVGAVGRDVLERAGGVEGGVERERRAAARAARGGEEEREGARRAEVAVVRLELRQLEEQLARVQLRRRPRARQHDQPREAEEQRRLAPVHQRARRREDGAAPPLDLRRRRRVPVGADEPRRHVRVGARRDLAAAIAAQLLPQRVADGEQRARLGERAEPPQQPVDLAPPRVVGERRRVGLGGVAELQHLGAARPRRRREGGGAARADEVRAADVER